MTRFVLHIGPHKTGTTAIQHFLACNRDRLLDQGIDFPLLGRHGVGVATHSYFSAYCRSKFREYPADFESIVRAWKPEAETCLLSSEDFWFCSKPKGIKRAFRLFGGDTRVICYLRDPVSHVASLYRERLKSGEVVPFRDFVEDHRQQMLGSRGFAFYAYERNLNLWAKKYSPEVVPYTNAMNVVVDFADRVGIARDGLLVSAQDRANTALNDESAALLRMINSFARQGTITEVEKNRLRDAVLKRNTEMSALIEGTLVRERIDMRPFKATFIDANPRYAHLAEGTPDSVEAVADSKAAPEKVLNSLREAVGQGPRPSRLMQFHRKLWGSMST